MKKLTITIEDDVYHGLQATIGRGNISRFLSNMARPYVVQQDMRRDMLPWQRIRSAKQKHLHGRKRYCMMIHMPPTDAFPKRGEVWWVN